MNNVYDSVDGKPESDTDVNDQRNLKQTNTEDKEPVRNVTPRSPYTDKSEFPALSLWHIFHALALLIHFFNRELQRKCTTGT